MKIQKKNLKKNIFYLCLIILPVTQFLIMYVYVNLNSFLMPFRDFNVLENKWEWAGFTNFEALFYDIKTLPELRYGFKNSLVFFAITFIFGISLSLLLSYYIYKKRFGAGFFRVLLFLPSIISSLVLAVIFRYYADTFLPTLLNRVFKADLVGFLSNAKTIMPTLMIFSVYCSFGVNVILYVGAMSAIPESIIEAADIDGAGQFRQFISIVLPQIVPTIEIFVTTTIAGIFVNQINLYSFYRSSLPYDELSNIGYYIYKVVAEATSNAAYPKISALGVIITLVISPIVIGTRYLFRKFNPMND